jgi:hypothetical protein
MHNSEFKILLFVFTICGLFGCGKSSSSDSPSAATTELEGSWKASCFANGTESRSSVIVVSKNTVTKTVSNYSDANCATIGDWGYKTTVSFELAAKSSEGLVPIDFRLLMFAKIPATASEATSFNSGNHCGLTGWVVGEDQDVTGRDCNGKTYKAGVIEYSSYQLSGDLLRFGQAEGPNDGTTAAKRASKIQNEISYTRQ